MKNILAVDSKYSNFGPVDFVTDDDFLKHHLIPTEESVSFWKAYLLENPGQKVSWQQAKDLLEAVLSGLTSYSRTFISEEDEARLLEKILLTNKAYFQDNEIRPLKSFVWYKIAAAACVAIAVLAGGYFALKPGKLQKVNYEERIAALGKISEVTRHTNKSSKPEHYFLPDSSMVILDPSSGLTFTSDYGKDQRVIYLSGKALLDVIPNAKKPFFVYANEIVTKVLGTRFEVVAFDEGADVTVKVLSGRVSVYRNDEDETDHTKTRKRPVILLLPNQLVVFNRNAEQFDKNLVDKPAPLPIGKEYPKFEYEDGYANQFFEDIKKAYGVNVVYNQDMMEHCQLSAILTDESMLEKIDVVCKTIGATYEVIDAQIIITSTGCTP